MTLITESSFLCQRIATPPAILPLTIPKDRTHTGSHGYCCSNKFYTGGFTCNGGAGCARNMRCAIHRAIVRTTSTADCRAIRYSHSSTITRLQSALHGSNSVVHCYSHSTQVLADFCLNFYCV
ncbi:unnamed protein product [Boreogadus saida]